MTPEKPSDPLFCGPSWVGLTDVGTGTPILALHGLPGSVRDFRWLGAVVEQGARLIRIDLPGFGATAMHTGPRDHEVAGFVARVIDEYIGEPVILMGHSFGTADVANVARHFPDRVSHTVLLAPIPLEPHRGFRNAPNFHVARRAMRIPFVKNILTPKVLQGYRAAGFRKITANQALRTFDRLAHFSYARHGENLMAMSQPTLIAWASDDPLIEDHLIQAMAKETPDGPRLRFVDGGHNIQKTQAVELGESLLNWISGD